MKTICLNREYFKKQGMFENEVYAGIHDLLTELKAKDKSLIVATYALENCHISDKSSAIMIGDREHDIIGANENGYVSVGNGISDIHEIKSAKDIIDEMTKDYCK